MGSSEVSRRGFMAAAAGSVVALGIGAAANGQMVKWSKGQIRRGAGDTYFEWIEVAKDVRMIVGVGWNSVAIKTSEGTVLVDTKTAPYAATLKREVGEVLSPVVRVISTSHHAEATGGNREFTKSVPVYGHSKATPRIEGQLNLYLSQLKGGLFEKKNANKALEQKVSAEYMGIYHGKEGFKPADFAPTKKVDAEEKWSVGGVEIEVTPAGPAMTDNDLVVRLPKLNVVCVGGLVCPGEYAPLEPNDGASVAGWEKALAAIKGKCDAKTVVVCSIGLAKGKTNVKAVDTQIAYFAALRKLVTGAIDRGVTRMDVLKLDASVLGKLGAPERLKRSLGSMYDEITKDRLK